jgi:enoyl-CoA hydratase
VSEDFASLRVSIADDIAHIRFTRPDLLNRFDEMLHAEFPRALTQFVGRQDLAALIISAEGKAFSAGGDLEMMLRANQSSAMRERLRQEGLAIIEGLLGLPFPIIAAVQGAAIGLGASLVGCCDIVVAFREAKLADPHVVLGLVAGDGGVMAWSQSVGVMRAKRYLLTGDLITGEQAHAMGMVTDLVDTPDATLPAAQGIAARIAALPRGGVRGTKRAFSRLSRDNYGAAFELSFAYEMESLGGDEVRAAVMATQTRRDRA